MSAASMTMRMPPGGDPPSSGTFPKCDDVIDRHLLLDLLSDTDTARVYRAISPEGTEVAMKFFRARTGRESFFNEINATCELRHERILPILRVGSVGDVLLYVVTRYCPLGTLASRLRDHAGGLPLCELLSALFEIATVLAHAHKHGVVHADIKPSNMLVESEQPLHVLVSDFNLARFGTLQSSACGTPAYAAPEQLKGQRPHPAWDEFGFGATGFELITGQRALTPRLTAGGDWLRSVPEWRLLDERVDVPLQLRDLVRQLMNPVPKPRPSMDRVRRELKKLITNH